MDAGLHLALPKARRTDTPAYEWTMLHRRNLLTRDRPSEVRFVSNVGADLLNATESALGEVA